MVEGTDGGSFCDIELHFTRLYDKAIRVTASIQASKETLVGGALKGAHIVLDSCSSDGIASVIVGQEGGFAIGALVREGNGHLVALAARSE